MGLKKNIKVTIIVPVYNAEKYLKGCIDSICKQSLDGWELLLIDDGSSDNSGQICDEYAERNECINVVHKQNEGVSIARNVGIALAQGNYIGFVDSDDTIESQMYEKMYSVAYENNAEIVMCDAITVFNDGNEEPDTITQLPKSCIIQKKDWTPSLLKEMAGSSWRCIYSIDLIKRNSIQFPAALKFSEDRVFNIYLMGYANKIIYLKEPFYNRMIWEDSVVHRFHEDYFDAVKNAAKHIEKALGEVWDDDSQYQNAYLEQFIMGAFAAINNYFYKTSTWRGKEKLNAVKMICCDNQLRCAIQKTSYGGIRSKWIMKKHYWLLSACAKYLNLKYGR